MPKVIVKTGTTQDGEYPLDLTRFTMRERAYIKDVSGTRPPDFSENWFGGDPKTVIATVAVMMQRAGRIPDIDVLLDGEDTAIVVDYTDLQAAEDGGDGPPSRTPSENGELGENAAAPEASG